MIEMRKKIKLKIVRLIISNRMMDDPDDNPRRWMARMMRIGKWMTRTITRIARPDRYRIHPVYSKPSAASKAPNDIIRCFGMVQRWVILEGE